MSDPTMPRRPGGRLISRPLHFIWLADGSGSMRLDGKIQALNQAIGGAIPYMRAVAREMPHASVFVNAIGFADEAHWMEERLTPVSEFQWQDITAGGATALGDALTMVGNVLQAPLMTDRALPPVIVLVSDGLPTDDFQAGLELLMSKPWGQQARRLVVAIGEDGASEQAQEIFRAFIANEGIQPLQANNPEALIETVRWVATAMLESIASPISQMAGEIETASKADSSNASPTSMGVETDLPQEADIW